MLFVDRRKWEIPHDETIEQDQYDRHDTCYILIEDQGQLIGFARLVATNVVVSYGKNHFTYMIKDAAEGKLPGIPSDLLCSATPPIDPAVWEMTRFHARNRTAMVRVFEAATEFLKSVEATKTVSFTRKSYCSILNGINLPSKRIGPVYRLSDGHRYCVIETTIP